MQIYKEDNGRLLVQEINIVKICNGCELIYG